MSALYDTRRRRARRNTIGVELRTRIAKVYLRELLAVKDDNVRSSETALCLGKNIGGESIIIDLARTPHLLVAGTTGSGKSVAINAMILSLVYRRPDQCRLIMVDPKMLELSVYDGIPHLLTPVVDRSEEGSGRARNGRCARWKSATSACPSSASQYRRL